MTESSQLKIIIIEDELPLLEIIKSESEKAGFEVVSARTVDQAIEYLKKISDIKGIWLDHYLIGKGSGLDFVYIIKQNEQWKNIPLFVVSNTASPDKKQAYLKLGATKFFTKSDHTLRDIIEDMKNTIVNGTVE